MRDVLEGIVVALLLAAAVVLHVALAVPDDEPDVRPMLPTAFRTEGPDAH